MIVWDRMAHGAGDTKTTFAPQYDTIIFATKGRFEFPGKRPKNVIASPKINSLKLTHPNEKPVDLMKQLIETVTIPGDTVLDPFAGSGSTLIAAKETGRHYIGIEIDEKYAQVARMRINQLKED